MTENEQFGENVKTLQIFQGVNEPHSFDMDERVEVYAIVDVAVLHNYFLPA